MGLETTRFMRGYLDQVDCLTHLVVEREHSIIRDCPGELVVVVACVTISRIQGQLILISAECLIVVWIY